MLNRKILINTWSEILFKWDFATRNLQKIYLKKFESSLQISSNKIPPEEHRVDSRLSDFSLIQNELSTLKTSSLKTEEYIWHILQRYYNRFNQIDTNIHLYRFKNLL